jgi:flagellar biosynthesis anti-sigma factor FlgM
MRIFGYYDNLGIDKTYLRQSRSVDQKKSVSDSAKVKKTDEIILSPRAAEMQKFEEIVKGIPDIQEGKSEAIKNQIESDEYKVSGKSVAKCIIDLIG